MELVINQTKNKIPVGYKQTEVGLIPEDWELFRFNEIGDAIIGLTYSPSNVSNSGKLVHRSSNIQDNSLAYQDNVYVNCSIPEKLILKENDILICVRNGSRNLIGKAAIIKGKSIGETFGAFMSVFRPKLYPSLIYQYFISNIVQNQINASLGATINQITNKTLNSFITPIPPTLKEQKAIATALSDVDELIGSIDQLITKKKAIKQGAMQELLTPSNTCAERSRSKGGKRLPGFDGDWVEKKLGEIAEVATGTTPPTSDLDNYGSDFCFVSPADLGKGKYITKTIKNLSAKGFAISRQFPKGSIMVTCIGSTIGKIGIAEISLTSNQQINAVFPNETFMSEYLYYQLSLMTKKIKIMASEQAVPMINKSEFSEILVTLPEIKEQKAIAKILSDMDKDIEQLEAKKDKYEQIKEGMMQDLLTGKIRLV